MRLSVCLSRVLMYHRQHLRDIFATAVNAVQPSNLIKANVSLKDDTITIVDSSFTLTKPCYIVGFGKAVFSMARELINIIGEHNVESGVLSIPKGSLRRNQMALSESESKIINSKLKIYEGALNNHPDEDAVKGAQAIYKLCEKLTAEDTLIVLISGGGSALLPAPRDGITLEEKQNLVKHLFDRGATIHDVNCIRKKLSKLKGGGLATLAYPAKIYSLILSDVIGDPLDTIASGPTVPDTFCARHNKEILKKYTALDKLTETMYNAMIHPRDTKRYSETFDFVHNFIIGNNSLACFAAEVKARELGYHAEVVTDRLEGFVLEIADFYVEIVHYIIKENRPSLVLNRFQDILDPITISKIRMLKRLRKEQPVGIICGGEPTIIIGDTDGKGGRNMHLALEVAANLNDYEGVHFLSCGTDGIDGPTDAAGAIAPFGLNAEELEKAQVHLEQRDSYEFFQGFKPDHLITTGHTGTNVMDIHILLFAKSNS